MSRSARSRVWLAVGLLGLFLMFPLIRAVKVHSRQDALQRRGVTTEAKVVGQGSRDTTDYLIVEYEACRCRTGVEISSPSRHPVGSMLPIRYDPRRPARADALVDRPNPYESIFVLLLGVLATIVLVVPILVFESRRRRAARRMAVTSAPTGRVRVETWRRAFLHSTVPYASVYPADVPRGGPPLFRFAIAEEADDELEDARGADFELFGVPEPGNRVALRRGEYVLIPVSKTKSAGWEAQRRGVLPPAAFADDDVALIREPSEGRKLLRLQLQLLLVYALVIPASLVRLVPESLLSLALAAVFAIVAAAAVTWWRVRRLLSLFASRLPGSSPANRRDRRAARAEVSRRIRSTQGKAQLAALLGTTTEALTARGRRAVRVIYGAIGLTGVVFVALVVRFALS